MNTQSDYTELAAIEVPLLPQTLGPMDPGPAQISLVAVIVIALLVGWCRARPRHHLHPH